MAVLEKPAPGFGLETAELNKLSDVVKVKNTLL